jgi:hypothetical protein
LRTAGSCLLTLVLLIGLSLIFCHSFGFIGIGYAVVCAEITWLFALAAQAQSLCGRRGDLFWVLLTR